MLMVNAFIFLSEHVDCWVSTKFKQGLMDETVKDNTKQIQNGNILEVNNESNEGSHKTIY